MEEYQGKQIALHKSEEEKNVVFNVVSITEF